MIIDIKVLTKQQFIQMVELVKLYFNEIEDENLDNDNVISYINNIEMQLEKYQSLHLLISVDNNKINGFLLGNAIYNYNQKSS